jgi:hypothetical protein
MVKSFLNFLALVPKMVLVSFLTFSNYAIISSWKDDSYRKEFLEKNEIMTTILSKCHKRIELKIDPYEFKGSWHKINPFKNDSSYKGGKILIITRARVKFRKLLEFLISTSKASKSIKNHSGALYYKGVGELPIIEQSTISIWESEEKMKMYAYSNSDHMQIITKARKRRWYSEELFVRCNIIHNKRINE